MMIPWQGPPGTQLWINQFYGKRRSLRFAPSFSPTCGTSTTVNTRASRRGPLQEPPRHLGSYTPKGSTTCHKARQQHTSQSTTWPDCRVRELFERKIRRAPKAKPHFPANLTSTYLLPTFEDRAPCLPSPISISPALSVSVSLAAAVSTAVAFALGRSAHRETGRRRDWLGLLDDSTIGAGQRGRPVGKEVGHVACGMQSYVQPELRVLFCNCCASIAIRVRIWYMHLLMHKKSKRRTHVR